VTEDESAVQTDLARLGRRLHRLQAGVAALAVVVAGLGWSTYRLANRRVGEFAVVKAGGYFLYDAQGRQRGDFSVDPERSSPRVTLYDEHEAARLELFSDLPAQTRPPQRLAGLRCFDAKGHENLKLYSADSSQGLSLCPVPGWLTSLRAAPNAAELRLQERPSQATAAEHLGSAQRRGSQFSLRPPVDDSGRAVVDAGIDFRFDPETRRPQAHTWYRGQHSVLDMVEP
jgi:hypothetical protein